MASQIPSREGADQANTAFQELEKLLLQRWLCDPRLTELNAEIDQTAKEIDMFGEAITECDQELADFMASENVNEQAVYDIKAEREEFRVHQEGSIHELRRKKRRRLEEVARWERLQARDVVRTMELDLEDMDSRYPHDLNEFMQAGMRERTRSEFDIEHLRTKSSHIRRLMDAEEAERIARVRAKLAGVEGLSEDESIFADFPSDGYPESLEAEVVATADRPKIHAWMEAVPRGSDPSQVLVWPKEVARMGAQKRSNLVGMSDSWSCTGKGRRREKIEEWQRALGRV